MAALEGLRIVSQAYFDELVEENQALFDYAEEEAVAELAGEIIDMTSMAGTKRAPSVSPETLRGAGSLKRHDTGGGGSGSSSSSRSRRRRADDERSDSMLATPEDEAFQSLSGLFGSQDEPSPVR